MEKLLFSIEKINGMFLNGFDYVNGLTKLLGRPVNSVEISGEFYYLVELPRRDKSPSETHFEVFDLSDLLKKNGVIPRTVQRFGANSNKCLIETVRLKLEHLVSLS